MVQPLDNGQICQDRKDEGKCHKKAIERSKTSAIQSSLCPSKGREAEIDYESDDKPANEIPGWDAKVRSGFEPYPCLDVSGQGVKEEIYSR